jgi:RNA polymerase sigma factor (sigma-70 family)
MVWTCESSWSTTQVPAPAVSRGGRALSAEWSERFRSLYQAEVVALLGYAARRVGRPEDAADVVADVFTIAWRRMDDVPAGDAARPWLYGVARNVLSNHRRGAWRQDRLTDRLRGELRRMTTAVQPANDDVDLVRDALGRLSADDRELLQLTAWEGLSPNEIAVAMDVPAGTVRSRLHRARRQLRRELQLGERWAPTGHVCADERPLVTEHEEQR